MSDSVRMETSAVGTFTTWARYILIAFAWLFAVGVVVQIYLAGLGFFESGDFLADHTEFGHIIGPLAYLLPILALLGRVGWPRGIQAIVVTVLYLVQVILPTLDAGYVAALHPLIAFLLLGGSFGLGMAVLRLVRSRA